MLLEENEAEEDSNKSTQNLEVNEVLAHRIGAVFKSEDAVHDAFENLLDEKHIRMRHIRVVRPNDPTLTRKRGLGLPRSDSKWYSTFSTYSIIGLLLGLFVGLVLWSSGPEFVTQTDWTVMIVAGSIGFFSGFTAAMTMEFSHLFGCGKSSFFTQLSSAVRDGHWALIVRVKTKKQRKMANDLMYKAQAVRVIE
ncbi:MAG: hypothetical protein HWE27_03115 [Gammaproteobacteria bacterium]|nr:hypothetical protein [Gammaproteobacteria bacterium]